MHLDTCAPVTIFIIRALQTNRQLSERYSILLGSKAPVVVFQAVIAKMTYVNRAWQIHLVPAQPMKYLNVNMHTPFNVPFLPLLQLNSLRMWCWICQQHIDHIQRHKHKCGQGAPILQDSLWHFLPHWHTVHMPPSPYASNL